MTSATVCWDFTQLAAGTRQRVFVETGRSEYEWVLKIPVANPKDTPYGQSLRDLRPGSLALRAVHNLAVRWPDAAHRRAQLARWRVAQLLGVGLGVGCAMRDTVIITCFRVTRERHFAKMLHMLDRIAQRGLTHALLPFQVVPHVRATLRTDNDALEEYEGAAVIQRHAAQFFHRSERFGDFDWRDVIDTQHQLWRHGMGLVDAVDILGPRNWALHEGHLRLADTSSMTTDRDVARRAVSSAVLDARVAKSLRTLGKRGLGDVAAEYFAFVRRDVNPAELERLWMVDGTDGGA